MLSKFDPIIVFILCITYTSCVSTSTPNEVAKVQQSIINNIHIDLSKYKPQLIRVENLYYHSEELFSGKASLISDDKMELGNVEIDNGKLNGLVLEWFPDGAKKTRKVFKEGFEDGIQKGWHTTGFISYEYEAEQGKILNVYKEYFPNGNMQIEKKYEDGVEVANKILNLNGKVIANYVLKNGRYYGLMGSGNCVTVTNLAKEK